MISPSTRHKCSIPSSRPKPLRPWCRGDQQRTRPVHSRQSTCNTLTGSAQREGHVPGEKRCCDRHEPLNARQLCVTFLGKLQLTSHHGFKGWIEVRNSKFDNLWQLFNELVVEQLKDLLGVIVFTLSPGKLARVVGRLVNQLSNLGSRSVVIK